MRKDKYCLICMKYSDLIFTCQKCGCDACHSCMMTETECIECFKIDKKNIQNEKIK